MPLNRIDKEIVHTLGFSFRQITANEISDKTGISWVTVKKHLTSLMRKGIVVKRFENKRGYYRLSSRMYRK